MTDDHDPTFREVAIRLEGKIDALSAKLDGRLDAVMAKIEAGDRESLQLFKLQENEIGHLLESGRENGKRVGTLEKKVEELHDLPRRVGSNEKRITDLEKATGDITVLRKVVYGLVAVILVAFVTAVSALVIHV